MNRKENRLAFLISLGWFLVLLCTIFISDYDGLYGQDSNEYYRYFQRITSFIRYQADPGDYFWPVHYPLAGALLRTITTLDASLQLISMISSAAVVGLLSLFLMRQFPGREPEIIFYVAVFMACSPFFFRFSVSCMSDVMAIAGACGSAYLAWKNSVRRTRITFFGSLFFAGMAVFTRFAMFPLLCPLVVYLVALNLKSLRLVDFATALILLLIPICIHIYFKEERSAEILQHSILGDWSFANYFKRIFLIDEGRLEYKLPNIAAVLLFLVLLGLVFFGFFFLLYAIFDIIKKSFLFFLLFGIVIVLYILFVAGLNYQNERYLVPLVPFYLVFCFPFYLSIVARLFGNRKRLMAFGLIILVIQLGLTARAFYPFLKLNQLEHKLAEAVIERNPGVVYTFGAEGTLVNRGYKGEVVSMFEAKLDTVDLNAMLLFNLKNNWAQWAGKNPMNNYWYLVQHGNPRLITTIGDGWELYEFTEKHSDSHPGISGQ